MIPLAERLRDLERDVALERGDFELFALVLREDSPDRWDLVMAAPWLNPLAMDDYELLAREIRTRLDAEHARLISRIVILQQGDPALEAFLRFAQLEHGTYALENIVLGSMNIQRAILITSTPRLDRKRRQATNQKRRRP